MKFYLIGKAYGTAKLKVYRSSQNKTKTMIKELENGRIFNKTLRIIQADSTSDAKRRYNR